MQNSLLVSLLFSASACQATPPIALNYSADQHVTLGTTVFGPRDVIVDAPLSGARTTLTPVALQALDGVNIVAFEHWYEPGVGDHRWYVVDVWVTLPGGIAIPPYSAFECVNATCANVVMLPLPPLPPGTHLDALLRDRVSGHPVFSIDQRAEIAGVAVGPTDLVLWDGVSLSRQFNGTALLFGQYNIDAADQLDDGRWLISFDHDGVFGGVAFADDDVLVYDPLTSAWGIFYRPRTQGSDWEAANLDALAVTASITDRIFESSFER